MDEGMVVVVAAVGLCARSPSFDSGGTSLSLVYRWSAGRSWISGVSMNELPPSAFNRRPPTQPFGRFLWGRGSLFRRTVTLVMWFWGWAWGSATRWESSSKPSARSVLGLGSRGAARRCPVPVALKVARQRVLPRVPSVDKGSAPAKQADQLPIAAGQGRTGRFIPRARRRSQPTDEGSPRRPSSTLRPFPRLQLGARLQDVVQALKAPAWPKMRSRRSASLRRNQPEVAPLPVPGLDGGSCGESAVANDGCGARHEVVDSLISPRRCARGCR